MAKSGLRPRLRIARRTSDVEGVHGGLDGRGGRGWFIGLLRSAITRSAERASGTRCAPRTGRPVLDAPIGRTRARTGASSTRRACRGASPLGDDPRPQLDAIAWPQAHVTPAQATSARAHVAGAAAVPSAVAGCGADSAASTVSRRPSSRAGVTAVAACLLFVSGAWTLSASAYSRRIRSSLPSCPSATARRWSADSHRDRPQRQARIFVTTLPCTSVSRKSRPWNL